ncbi:MAG: efflux RND transporter permease subunit, partial [Deltaproteobacteria bacterium]|nr:efflux RND transporter permease subunit [Deltaproteobacteria bacterium]
MSEGKAPPSTERVTGGLAGFVRPFLESHLAVLLVIVAVALGAMAIAITPREEDPQIVVPLADVFVSAPGVTAREVERLVATPLERLLWQIDGVEHVYSRSAPGMAVVTVRFYVGEDRERSLVKLHNKISMNEDEVPPLVRGWVIKPVEIDDVPILALTLSSDRYDDHMLRRMAEELLARLAVVPEVSRTSLYGGRPQVIRVELDPEILAGRGLTPLAVSQALAGADASLTVGAFDRDNQSFTVTSDAYLQNAAEVRNLVVGVHQARPVYLSEVARVYDGPAEVHTYTRLGFSERWRQDHGQEGPAQTRPAVTVGLAKKRGTNAVTMAANVLSLLEELKGKVLPAGVEVTVTRNYGETAKVKSDELIQNLGFAVVTVVALLAFTLGWREALVVAIAVPLSFAMALFVNYLFGYTINRVTMFALILSLG